MLLADICDSTRRAQPVPDYESDQRIA